MCDSEVLSTKITEDVRKLQPNKKSLESRAENWLEQKAKGFFQKGGEIYAHTWRTLRRSTTTVWGSASEA